MSTFGYFKRKLQKLTNRLAKTRDVLRRETRDVLRRDTRDPNAARYLHYRQKLSPDFVYSWNIEDANLASALDARVGGIQGWLWNHIVNVHAIMYGWPDDHLPNEYVGSLIISPVTSLTLIVKNFRGVAYTKDGNDTGSKEIAISLQHIWNTPANRRLTELEGVLCHEMVHALQYDGKKTAPSGYIEGLADFYRMNLNLSASHWRRTKPQRWDEGYEKSAFFFRHLESQHPGIMNAVNAYLRDHRWSDNGHLDPFQAIMGIDVERLWNRYTI